MKLSSSTKIAIGAAALVGGVWLVLDRWAAYSVDNLRFPPVKPGVVSLIAMDPRSGYRIRVANEVAQLVELASAKFGAPDQKETGETGESDVAGKRRIPMKEMLRALQGDDEALGRLVMSLNELKEPESSAEIPVWTAERIRRAFSENGPDRKKLENDLNSKLSGDPLRQISFSRVFNGILVDSPVPVKVRIGDSVQTRIGRIREPYKTQLMRNLEVRLQEKFNITNAQLVGYYREEIAKIDKQPAMREDVAKSLQSMLDERRLLTYADAPERVLKNTTVILNESHISSVDEPSATDAPNNKKLYTLTLNLTDEGHKRLWKFSRGRSGFNLLLVVNGVAIAAPRITHELKQSTVSITQMPNKFLVYDAVDRIRKSTNFGGKQS